MLEENDIVVEKDGSKFQVHTDPHGEIIIPDNNFVIADFYGFCHYTGGIKLLKEFIEWNGGVVRSSTVRNTDYVITCSVDNGVASYKEAIDKYNRALELRAQGKKLAIISDMDFYIHFNLFSKLRMDNKLRVAKVYQKDPQRFDEKTAKIISKFIDKQKETYKYKDFFLDYGFTEKSINMELL